MAWCVAGPAPGHTGFLGAASPQIPTIGLESSGGDTKGIRCFRDSSLQRTEDTTDSLSILCSLRRGMGMCSLRRGMEISSGTRCSVHTAAVPSRRGMEISSGTRCSVHTAAVPCIAEASASAVPSAALCGSGGGSKQVVCLRSVRLGSRVEAVVWRALDGSGSRRRGSLVAVRAKMMGEDPDWTDEDYIVVGLGHCFVKDEAGKLKDKFVVEPIPAGAVECMDNGGTTCYKVATATTLGVALKQNGSLLPAEFAGAQFCDDFDFRAKCASRTWKREHPQTHLLNLVPKDGVRSDFNFSLLDKRILNMENVVDDSDNIKQDMSIDVYGRQKEEEDMSQEIASLYSV